MNCIIIEDQPPAQRILKKYIEDTGSLHLKNTFSDAVQAIAYLKSEPVDLIFLDIHLPKISGIDFLKALPNPPHVILTTAFPDYALESYEFNVVDYLLKPFSFQRFVKAISKVPPKNSIDPEQPSGDPNPQPRKVLFIKSGYDHIKLTVDAIIYIKSDADYTELFVKGKKTLTHEPLRYWLENLDQNQFVRVHKSFIINVSKIERIAAHKVHLTENITIPLGRAYKDNFIKRFVK